MSSNPMRLIMACAASLAGLVMACTPVTEAPHPPARPRPAIPQPAAVDHPAAAPELLGPRLATCDVSGIRLRGVAFDSRGHRLTVIDQAAGPGSRFADAAAAAAATGALAAVKGGFFMTDGAPLGLVVAGGRASGAWNARTSLGSALWLEDPHGRSAIVRREAIGPTRAKTQRHLLQAGPMLLEYGRPVAGLDSIKSSARTILLWDGSHRWWMGVTSPCTLAALSTALASARPAGWPLHHALNLDGGRSSELWVSPAVAGGPLTIRPPWNRSVRNFLVLLPAR